MTVARQIGVATRLDGIRDQSARCNDGKPQDDAGKSGLPHAGRNRGIAMVALDETTEPRHRDEREAKTGQLGVQLPHARDPGRVGHEEDDARQEVDVETYPEDAEQDAERRDRDLPADAEQAQADDEAETGGESHS